MLSEAKHLPQGVVGRLFATAQSDNEKALTYSISDSLKLRLIRAEPFGSLEFPLAYQTVRRVSWRARDVRGALAQTKVDRGP